MAETLSAVVTHSVAILRKKDHYGGWEYSLHCNRCNKGVYGARTGTWASKAGAAKVAKEHLARHRRGDTWLERVSAHYEHVGTVTE